MLMRDPKQAENSPRAEVLRFIQREGSASIKDLEAAMGVTTTAVREQVAHLLHEGFLQATRVRGDVGRPYYVYSLTTKAQELFPKDYATLAVLLLEETIAMHGPEGLRLLLNRVSNRMADKLADHTQGRELSQKLLGLVAALGETGMEVSMQPVENREGDFVLRTPTCPYFEVAKNHREICDMEQEMMSELLGPGVGVKLSSCLIDGQPACEFHVTSAPINFEAKKKEKEITSVGVPE
jgi:DeoR family transcriptional regulator, suf operon transcriptional repressor